MNNSTPINRQRKDLENRNRREPVKIQKLPTSRFLPRQEAAV